MPSMIDSCRSVSLPFSLKHRSKDWTNRLSSPVNSYRCNPEIMLLSLSFSMAILPAVCAQFKKSPIPENDLHLILSAAISNVNRVSLVFEVVLQCIFTKGRGCSENTAFLFRKYSLHPISFRNSFRYDENPGLDCFSKRSESRLPKRRILCSTP